MIHNFTLNKFFQFNYFFELGQIFHDCTAYQLSIEYLDKAIELSTYLPINKNRLVKVYELRGNSKIFLNNYQESILDFSKAIELDPKNSFLYFGRGMCYEYLNQNEEALKNLKISLMLDPEFSLALSMVDYLENEKNI